MNYENLTLYNQWLHYQKKCLEKLINIDTEDKEKISFLYFEYFLRVLQKVKYTIYLSKKLLNNHLYKQFKEVLNTIKTKVFIVKKRLAQATLNLVSINREKDSTNRQNDRYVTRLVEWDKADDSLRNFNLSNSAEMTLQIGRSLSGFISSWLTVFKDYKEVKKEISVHTLGTDYICFDSDFNPIESLDKP